MRVTPVPIPNTMVKTQAADGTSLETVRESRWPPNLKKKNKHLSSNWFYAVIRAVESELQVSSALNTYQSKIVYRDYQWRAA